VTPSPAPPLRRSPVWKTIHCTSCTMTMAVLTTPRERLFEIANVANMQNCLFPPSGLLEQKGEVRERNTIHTDCWWRTNPAHLCLDIRIQ
jgi:hypothetical protein